MSFDANNRKKRVFVGTCGWSYKVDWQKVFYPTWLPEYKYLEFYAHLFRTNEIDSSFYRIPQKHIVENWDIKTPKDFKFSAKIPQDISHKAKLDLQSIKDSFHQYADAISPLEKSGKMLSHLLQLPPNFTASKHETQLENFLNYWQEWRENEGKLLSAQNFNSNSWRITVEFRNLSWMQPKYFELLRKYNAVYCAVIEPLLPPRMDVTTNDLFYLRFHGFGNDPWFNYKFSDPELDKWAQEVNIVIDQNPNITVVSYFNNHFSGNAVKNAIDFIPRLHLTPSGSLDDVIATFESQIHSNFTKKTKRSQMEKSKEKTSSLDGWIKKE